MTEGIITLRADRAKPVSNRHPWIFSGAIASANHADPGGLVRINAPDGSFLARGYWNERSQIQVRILTWTDEPIDADWWRNRLIRAIEARGPRTEKCGCRLIHAENDFLPGLVVDEYAGWLVLQALTLHIDQNKQQIAQLLMEITGAKGIYERSDVDVRKKEGLKASTGALIGDQPPAIIEIAHDGLTYQVDVIRGHKTGFYLDQQVNYGHLPARDGGTLLNLFSYTGSFGLHAAAKGYAQIDNVDSSQHALDISQSQISANGFDAGRFTHTSADVFDDLRQRAQRGQQYDTVVVDPPKFAQNKQQVDKAARGYKDLNLYALKLVKPGGTLLTFSCSGAINRDLFQKIVFGAAVDAHRDVQIVEQLGAAPDHPIAITFPEGEYLKGFVLRVF